MNIEQLQNLPDAEKAKLFAAWHALAEVKDEMNIGLGSGSTASWFVKLLAGKQSHGLKFRACATSSQTTELAESLGIKIESLDDFAPSRGVKSLDLVIDGADEFDPAHNLIKGGGGALLQEKLTAQMAKRFIVITDASKAVDTLGAFPLPVEIVRFAWQTTRMHIVWALDMLVSGAEDKGNKITRRMVDDKPFITDEGHYILDLDLEFTINPSKLDDALQGAITGVVETGLFVGMADAIIMADSAGIVRTRETGGDWVETRYELAEIADMLPRY